MITHNKNNDYTGFLGNRMFQIASTIGIAVKNNLEYSFIKTEYSSNFPNIPYKDLSQINFIDIPEKSFGYVEEAFQNGNNYNLLGYRQSEKYFAHCKDLIKYTFEFNKETINTCKSIYLDLIKQHTNKKLISIHIRCGDYLSLKEHHTCLMDIGYYQKAITEFDAKETVFIVFSDDVNIASNFFKTIPNITYLISERLSSINDMCLMSMLDGHVIANSSYSWWSAWLSGKETISPSKNKWFGSAYNDMEVKDIIPESWKQIE